LPYISSNFPTNTDDDDDQDGGAAGGAGQQQQQMIYIPGIGHLPLSSLQGLPGILGGAGGTRAPQQPKVETDKEWDAFANLPFATQQTLTEIIETLRDEKRTSLTVLVLGKGGVGKSSTVNSILNERAATTLAFQPDTARPTMFSRTIDGFSLNFIDTPGPLDGDNVSEVKLEQIAKATKGKDIDVVLFLERLDIYAVDALDHRMLQGITRVLGAGIWTNAVLGLTRASANAPPPGIDFTEHVVDRVNQLRSAIRQAGGYLPQDCPVALIENSSRCPTNDDGEKLVTNILYALNGADDEEDDKENDEAESITPEIAWVVELMERVAEVALNNAPFDHDPVAAAKAANPDKKNRWVIPVAIAAQLVFKMFLNAIIDRDARCNDLKNPSIEEKLRAMKEARKEKKREKEMMVSRRRKKSSSSRRR